MTEQLNKWFCFYCMSEHATEESLQECRSRLLEELEKMTKDDHHRRLEFVRRWSVRNFEFRS